jgi:autotransporter-associated beta strand protein
MTLRRNDSTVNVNGGSTLAVAALANTPGTNPTVNVGSGSTLQITSGGGAAYSGVIAGAGQLSKDGGGTATFTGANTLAGAVLINSGTLALSGSGSFANSPILHVGAGATFDVSGVNGGLNYDGSRFQTTSGQTLRGSGTIQGGVTIGAGSTLAPGTPAAPGALLAAGDLVMLPTSTYMVKLNGTTPGVTHDTTQVNGSATLVFPELNVAIGGGYLPSGNDKVYILIKSGTDPIVGQFNNVPEGAQINVGGGYSATVSYLGDSTTSQLTGGNDVVVYNFTTAVPEPGALIGLSAIGLVAVRSIRRRFGSAEPAVAA